jgi:penicillin-binding protein 1A
MNKYIEMICQSAKRFWQWYKGLYKGRRWYTKTGVGLVSFIVAFMLYLFMVDINFLWLFGKSPSLTTIMNPKNPQASELYSADNVLIGKYFSENRTPVSYEEVNPMFWRALIDTEDERFYQHFGIDFQAVFAALKDYVVHHDARGASTITQQLVKNMFRVRTEYSTGLLGYIPGVKMLIMKSKE